MASGIPAVECDHCARLAEVAIHVLAFRSTGYIATSRDRLKTFTVPADERAMGDLSAQRWRRYGKDRLYVNTADGQRVGWVDLLTGTRSVEQPDLREAFEQAIASHLPEGRPQDDTPLSPQPAALPVEPPGPNPHALADHEPFAIRIDFTDLAVRKPGQAAREQAVAQRRAAPVRSMAARLLGGC